MIDETHERHVALKLCLLIFILLTVGKSLAFVSYLGAAIATLTIFLQLYLPLWRCEKLHVSAEFVGLHFKTLHQDLKNVLLLCVVFFPLYVLVFTLGLYGPSKHFVWQFPSFLWLLELVLTQFFGVALPEETFFRGYLQPRFEAIWSPGKAIVFTSLLFALGHFLGEWQPLRLLTFFPSLLFGGLRQRTKSVIGAIIFHALCNILSALLFKLYLPL